MLQSDKENREQKDFYEKKLVHKFVTTPLKSTVSEFGERWTRMQNEPISVESDLGKRLIKIASEVARVAEYFTTRGNRRRLQIPLKKMMSSELKSKF